MRPGHIVRKNARLKPMVDENDKVERLEFVMSHVKEDGTFDSMEDVIHVDEKRFYDDKLKRNI